MGKTFAHHTNFITLPTLHHSAHHKFFECFSAQLLITFHAWSAEQKILFNKRFLENVCLASQIWRLHLKFLWWANFLLRCNNNIVFFLETIWKVYGFYFFAFSSTQRVWNENVFTRLDFQNRTKFHLKNWNLSLFQFCLLLPCTIISLKGGYNGGYCVFRASLLPSKIMFFSKWQRWTVASPSWWRQVIDSKVFGKNHTRMSFTNIARRFILVFLRIFKKLFSFILQQSANDFTQRYAKNWQKIAFRILVLYDMRFWTEGAWMFNYHVMTDGRSKNLD